MKILFAVSECVPFVKTGGLADVAGALPKALRALGEDVRVILPLYREMAQKWRDQLVHRLYFYVDLGWRHQYVGISELEHEGVLYYFVDNEYYFGRPYVYGLGGDEPERFGFFSRAVLDALTRLDFKPDVLHCHDWQAGMIPLLLNLQYRPNPFYADIRTVFTIHNLQYQGVFPQNEVEEFLTLGRDAYGPEQLDFYGQASFLKGGVVNADHITTVSPTYAQEIQLPYYGERLDGLMRARSGELTGILNGIDTAEYDPANDPLIYTPYDADHIERKKENKTALQAELGLNVREDIPLVGMVTRLTGQKGLELIEAVIERLLELDLQLAVLGVGEDHYIDLFNWAAWKYPGKVAVRIEMNHTLAHRIYAGSDLFLMPSRFEPCGLSQMISMRYGTLPIVRETGGLRDTVLSYNEFTGEGNGFTFFNFNAHDMLATLERALIFYHKAPDVWRKLIRRTMAGDYSWNNSARKYLDVYKKIAAR